MSYTTYLAHHGIKGQKWGVRRFQNYDGTRIKDPLANTKKIYKTVKRLYAVSDGYGDRPEHHQVSFKDRLLYPQKARRLDAENRRANDYDRREDKVKDLVDNVIAQDTATADKVESLALNVKKTGSVCIEDYTKNVDFYRTVAGLAEADRHSYKDWSKEDVVKAYRQGTKNLADEGPYNSYDYCLVANGKNPTEVRAAYDKALDSLRDFSWKISEKALGEYANKFMHSKHGGGYATPILGKYVMDSAIWSVGGLKENPIEDTFYYEQHRPYDTKELKQMKSDIEKYRKQAESIVNSKREVSHSVIVNDDIYSYRSYLAHHGIKGQKWGVRRFQKADGSLTAAGAKRYGIKGAMSAGRKVGAGLVKAARGGIQKAKEVKARKAAEKLERQKKVWAKTRLGLTMNADKFSIEELREANNRLDERDRAARGLAEQVKRGVGYFQAIRDVTGAIKDTKDYIEDISGEKGKKAKAADELKYQRELEKEKRTYERDMVRDQLKANQEYEYKREKDKLDRESKEKIEKMKAKAKKKKESGGSDSDPEPDESPKKKSSRENTTEFEDVYWNSPKKDREFMETVFPKEVDEAKERKKRRNKAHREVDEAIRRMGFFGHSDISTYGSYLAHHGIKGQKWGVRRFQNEDGTLTKAGLRRQAKAEKIRSKAIKRYDKKAAKFAGREDETGVAMRKAYEKLGQHMKKMTVDDIYDERKNVRAKAIGSAVIATIGGTLASSFVGIPNIASLTIGPIMGVTAYRQSYDAYRAQQIAHTVIFADDNALEHHGIKGQKWGVRRFQDEAGRLTSAGKKHAAELRDKVTSKLKINAKSIDFEAQGGGGGGNIDGWEEMTEEEDEYYTALQDATVDTLLSGQFSEEEVAEYLKGIGVKSIEEFKKLSNKEFRERLYQYTLKQKKETKWITDENGKSALEYSKEHILNALFGSDLRTIADAIEFHKPHMIAEGKKALAELRKKTEKVDKESGLHLKRKNDDSKTEDMENVNPGFENYTENSKNNCMCCTTAYDMRRRGYDVTAVEVSDGFDSVDVNRWYPDAKVEDVQADSVRQKHAQKFVDAKTEEEQLAVYKEYKEDLNKQLQKELVSQGNGARGNLMVQWDAGGGHSMAYEVEDGVAYIYDCQTGTRKSTMEVVATSDYIQYARLDNVDFDPEKIKEVVH